MYIGILSEQGEKVPDSEAYDYALERCLNGSEKDKQEFREMLVDWFFSGDFIHEKGEE